ncbi:hypothetical protein TruAng_004665 [Truncatella angustata]|nr:hypothetical protein TruAng_004665 [Truncatella angustata]
MAPPASVLSRTLQSISVTKIHEIEKQRARYEERKNEVLKQADRYPNEPHKRITTLSQGLADLYPEALQDRKVKNIKYWLQQARYDASVPANMIESWEDVLRSKLEVQSRKLGLAHLYSQLVTEWMNPTSPIGEVPVADDASFEVVDRQKERLQELCDKFEKVVFVPLETDEVEIDLFMKDLFEGDKEWQSLEGLREQVKDSGESLMRQKNPFDTDTLKWCLRGLLAEDLLSDEKQVILRDFLDNEVALKEIGDVLNMRYADFDSWQWQAGADGIPILPRQQLNGKYRIWMDEDVLQAIFIEYVGIQCCIMTKSLLKAFVESSPSWEWTSGAKISPLDRLRRQYYTAESIPTHNSVDIERKKRFINQFFLSQLPGTVDALGAGTYVNDGAANDDEDGGEMRAVQNIKQSLLRTIATETLFNRTLNGEAAVLQSDLQWYATGLSHTTIFAVMRFFGFPLKLIEFYKKVLEAPLNMTPATEGEEPKGPKIRRRGVPMAHATEKFIGELVLFVMDLVVNRETGLLLYRLHDDLFLCGRPHSCARAWKAMQEFAKVMGLDFNKHKTGSVYLVSDDKLRDPLIESTLPKGTVEIGHLLLDPASGDWTIDQEQVNTHILQLGKQLAACDSILSWVQTWNSCIGRFFSHTFGEPAFCLGTKHLDSILETYERMQSVLFGNPVGSVAKGYSEPEPGEPGNVVQYLKVKIQERFGVSDVSNSFIFLPEQLGGLGVRNPFIPMLTLREDLSKTYKTPQDIIREWSKEDQDVYHRLEEEFREITTVEDRLRRLRELYSLADKYEQAKEATRAHLSREDLDTFYSYEEHSRWRETTSSALFGTYLKLVDTPRSREPTLHEDVAMTLSDLNLTSSGGRTIAQEGNAKAKAGEIKWALQMFRDELLDRYGGLRLVDEKFLTLGLLTMMRSKAIRWNMVL